MDKGRDNEYVVEIVGEGLCRIEEIAKKAHISESSIRRYIRLGLITPVKRERGCYLLKDTAIFRISKIHRLRRDMGINLCGIGVVLDLLDRIEDLYRQLSDLRIKL